MRIFTHFLTLTLIVFFSFSSNGQNRYLEPVFDEVTVSNLTPLATNYTILQWLFAPAGPAKHTIRQPLVAQFYYPKGDTETNRPLVIYVHTGNFFPYPDNGSCGGTMRDSSNVEIATRLAKMGYVVAVVNYRQGWNPFDQNELIRRFFLINATYRGIQDMSTYARYFRRSVAQLGNPHGIDPEKITIWGQGTGGYLSLASSYLKSYPEIFNTADGLKFYLTPPLTPQNIPMARENYNGTLTGEGAITTVDAQYNAYTTLPIGDTLCTPSHEGFSSDFALCVNMGGALGDSTWLSPGEIPLISFHVDTDPFAPVETDVLNVPTPLGPQPVVEVSGSRDLAERADRLGNNNLFTDLNPDFDPINENNPVNNLGYYEFRNTPNGQSSPWEWSATETTTGGATGCNINSTTAKTYIDTIMTYFAPRACIALDLPCKQTVSSTKDLSDSDVELSLAPNPASTNIKIEVSKNTPVRNIKVMDLSGRVINKISNVNSNLYQLQRNGLQTGMYILRLEFDNGILNKKIMFN